MSLRRKKCLHLRTHLVMPWPWPIRIRPKGGRFCLDCWKRLSTIAPVNGSTT